ncbi:MAG: hypothetical protein D8B56_04815 [Alloprevotella sp.]|nr:MAG: hypothetical protein D8B56_04815 [Alloprevotella sp.]
MLQKQNVTTIRIMKTKNDRLCFSGKGVVSTRNSFHMENDISSCQIERNLQTVFEMANFSLEKMVECCTSILKVRKYVKVRTLHIFVNTDKNSRFVWQSGIYVLLLRSHLLLSNPFLPIEKTLRATFIKSKL